MRILGKLIGIRFKDGKQILEIELEKPLARLAIGIIDVVIEMFGKDEPPLSPVPPDQLSPVLPLFPEYPTPNPFPGGVYVYGCPPVKYTNTPFKGTLLTQPTTGDPIPAEPSSTCATLNITYDSVPERGDCIFTADCVRGMICPYGKTTLTR